jgi:hypothetical protein
VRTEIHLVTEDISLVAIVGAHLAHVAFVRLVSLRDAGVAMAGDHPPLVLVDVRARNNAAAVRRARLQHPHSTFIAIVAPTSGPRDLYVAGAAAVVPADGAAIAACCSSFVRPELPSEA